MDEDSEILESSIVVDVFNCQNCIDLKYENHIMHNPHIFVTTLVYFYSIFYLI